MISTYPNRKMKLKATSPHNKVGETYMLCSETEGIYFFELDPAWISQAQIPEPCYVHFTANGEQNVPKDYAFKWEIQRCDVRGRFIAKLGSGTSTLGSLAHEIIWVWANQNDKISLVIKSPGQRKYRKGLLTRYSPMLKVFFGKGQDRDGHRVELGQ